VYRPDPDLPPDHAGRVPCVCGALPDNRRHEVGDEDRAPPDGWRELDMRRTGERED
jgi:hypothetical protein